jgi:hypothetical protein
MPTGVNCFAAAVTSAELMNAINESTGHYNVREGVPSVQKRRTQFYANVKSSMVTFPGNMSVSGPMSQYASMLPRA